MFKKILSKCSGSREENDSNESTSRNSASIFQDYARNLAREGKFREALSVYSVSARQTGPNMDVVSDIGELMIEQFTRKPRARRRMFLTDPWSCFCCASILIDPVSVACGHTACKQCLSKETNQSCRKCGKKFSAVLEDPVNDIQIKTSILVSELVKKYWAKEIKVYELRNEGNKLFQRGEEELSVRRYSEAFALVETDHLLTSNRSHAFFKLGRYEEALEDAERTISIRPDWGKGYFRKGMALQGLGEHGEALVSFFECLVLEENISKLVKTEIYKVLFRLVSEEISKVEDGVEVGVEAGVETGVEATGTERSKLEPEKSEKESAMSEVLCGSEKESYMSVADKTVVSRMSEGVAEEDKSVTGTEMRKRLLIPRNRNVCRAIEQIEERFFQISEQNFKPANRYIDPVLVDVADFECSLCFRLLWEPVTTVCGHTYCKSCLDRSLDHRPECPLCKAELTVIAGKMEVNEFIDQTIRRMLPSEYLDRRNLVEEEFSELTGTRTDGRVEVPIFVCTMSFPSIPCPLHVFEPRYRLMIRRAMESGTREFGMCVTGADNTFSNFGTMLEIRDIKYFADGRSVVETIGSRRFRVLERGSRDGYSTAVVEFLFDLVPEGESLVELKDLHDQTQILALNWFNNMEPSVKTNIISHYGVMPEVEREYWSSQSGPAWSWWVLAILPLDTLAQQQILCQTSLKRRLEAITRIIGYMKRRGGQPS